MSDVAANVRSRLDDDADQRIESVDWFETLESTNDYLLAAPRPAPAMLRAAIADEQTSGRGRGDKRWVSSSGGGLWLSVSYTFEPTPVALSTLTLAVGSDVARCLAEYGAPEVRLKWPNDLMLDDRKLGGILVESRTAATSSTVVCGIGINLREPEVAHFSGREHFMLPVGLEYATHELPRVDDVAARIIGALIGTFERFADVGLAGFAGDWSELDWLRGRRVTLIGEPHIRGTAHGINDDGELIIRSGELEFRVVAGTVRLDDASE